MDTIDIVMICVMIPGIILTLWAVGRIGSSSYNSMKDKSDREKDDRKEIRSYFLKHDDYVLDDKGYRKLVENKAKDWTPMNAAMKLGIEDPDKLE